MAEYPEGMEVAYGASTEAEASLIAGLLESAGIPAVLLDQNVTTYQIVMATANRGFRVAVPRARAEEAEEVLIENGFVDPELQKPIPPGAGVCPKCLYTVLPEWDSCGNCGEAFDWVGRRRSR